MCVCVCVCVCARVSVCVCVCVCVVLCVHFLYLCKLPDPGICASCHNTQLSIIFSHDSKSWRFGGRTGRLLNPTEELTNTCDQEMPVCRCCVAALILWLTRRRCRVALHRWRSQRGAAARRTALQLGRLALRLGAAAERGAARRARRPAARAAPPRGEARRRRPQTEGPQLLPELPTCAQGINITTQTLNNSLRVSTGGERNISELRALSRITAQRQL